MILGACENKKLNIYFATHKTCNLNCRYCYVPFDSRSENRNRDEEIVESLKKLIRKFIADNYFIGKFCFHGTEPSLMSAKAMVECLNLLSKNFVSKGQKTIPAIQTNGINLSKDYLNEISENVGKKGLHIGFSIDPPFYVHNELRGNSWEKVNENYLWAIKNGFSVSSLNVISNLTLDHLDGYLEWIKEQISLYQTFGEPHNIKLKFATGEYSLDQTDMIRFADFLIDNDLSFLAQIFNPGYCIMNGNECEWYEFDVEGNCYSCNKAYEPKGIFANWHYETLDDITKRRKSLYKNSLIHVDCNSCEFEYVCNSGCPIDRIKYGADRGKAHECVVIKRVYDYIQKNGSSIAEFLNKGENNIKSLIKT